MTRTLALAAILLALGCARRELSGPPTIRPARDECAECGMLISEERAACGILARREGRLEHVVFDDPGCLLDFLWDKQDPPVELVTPWVRDHETLAWLDARSAAFLFAPDTLATPMGSGIAGFTSRAEAERVGARSPGPVITFDELIVARREWMWARYGKPADAPELPSAGPR